ncbi:MAG: 4-carboxy-2-hydroxymuconate semialdehyde dehydrogenase [Rhizobacter sp.]|nr:4-carboxy-2-hydroxymuconate semialdehyde dehydrogenase [Rhizobacter sp.]
MATEPGGTRAAGAHAQPVNIALAGEGAIAQQHMEALSHLPGVKVVVLTGGVADDTRAFAARWAIADWSLSLADALVRPDVDAVVLATPSGLHAAQAQACLAADKHVLIEIPMALNLTQAEHLADSAARSQRVAMVAHTRRFNPPHRELRRQITSGVFHLQHLVSETYFFRRSNENAAGQPRSWTDDLLWHHACHSVDLAMWLLDDPDMQVWAHHGPLSPTLGIPMDLSIGMRSPRHGGALVTLALSFNNRGPFGGFYRYIGEEETYRAHRDELLDSRGQVVATEGASGITRQDAEFIAAIRESRMPESSVAACLPAMRLLDRIEKAMHAH